MITQRRKELQVSEDYQVSFPLHMGHFIGYSASLMLIPSRVPMSILVFDTTNTCWYCSLLHIQKFLSEIRIFSFQKDDIYRKITAFSFGDVNAAN